MFQSMRRITDSEVNSVVPRRLQVVTVQRGDTVASLARRMAYTSAQEERFRVLNALASGEQVTPGQKVKLAVRSR
jgi:predicted Zn-dependent protease